MNISKFVNAQGRRALYHHSLINHAFPHEIRLSCKRFYTTNAKHVKPFQLAKKSNKKGESIPIHTINIRNIAEKQRSKNVKQIPPMKLEDVSNHFAWYQVPLLTNDIKKEVISLYQTAIDTNFKHHSEYPVPKSRLLKSLNAQNPKFYVYHSRIFTSIVNISSAFKKQNIYSRLDMLDPDLHFEHTELFVRALHLWFIFRRACHIPGCNEFIQRLSLHFWAEIEAKMVEKGFPENNLTSLQRDLNSYVHGFFESLNLSLSSDSDNDAFMAEVLWRHLYQGRIDIHFGNIAWWIGYIRAQLTYIDEIPDLHFLNGEFEFIDPSMIPGLPVPSLPKS